MKKYAKISPELDGLVIWVFTPQDVPQWDENLGADSNYPIVEIPEDLHDKVCARSWAYLGGAFSEITPDPDAELKDKIRAVRNRRNDLLSRSDWTQMPDVQINPDLRQQWATYRQALRDIPSQPGFPHTVVWPQAPATN